MLFSFIVGLFVTILLGTGVKGLLNKIELKQPEGMKPDDWNMITEHFSGGDWIGFFERILILVSFSMDKPIIIGGWFAFKVAAKWETWRDIIKFPDILNNYDPLVWYRARKRYGSWVLTRFLTGTLLNILIGAFGANVGSHFCEFVAFLKNGICK
jgi:hypothetical protein